MKLDMRQTILESCKKRGNEHERAKAGAANRTRPIQDRERDGESKNKRVQKVSSVIGEGWVLSKLDFLAVPPIYQNFASEASSTRKKLKNLYIKDVCQKDRASTAKNTF